MLTDRPGKQPVYLKHNLLEILQPGDNAASCDDKEANMIGSDRSNTFLFRHARGAVARCLLIAVPLAISPAAHAAYNLTFVTDPTLTGVINLLGINDSGTIAGFDNGVTNAGFTLTLPHAFTVVNFPGAASTQVTGINGAGDLSGFYVDTLGNTHGFTRIGGSFATVDNPLSTVFNQALGINNSNETVGYFAPTATGTPGDVAYSQTGGSFTDINHLLPTNFNSQAVGINSTATPWIVGFYQPDAGLTTSFGFVDEGGTITEIDPFGSTFTQALGVNDLGEIVGFYTNGTGQHGYIDNGGVFTSFDPPGSASTTINGINDKGDIVGFYTNPTTDTVDGFVGTPVPEPSTWAMMLAGFAGLGFLGYRKVRQGKLAA
jgi:PEP-CTERM motif